MRELSDKANALVQKLVLIHEDPRYLGVWQLYMIHGGVYEGPTYTQELAELAEVLSRSDESGSVGEARR